MDKAETGKLLDKIARLYPSFRAQTSEAPAEVLAEWYRILVNTSYADAASRVEAYASISTNKWAPHPGALASSEAEQYHEQMRQNGSLTLEEMEQMRASAVAPTAEQRAKARGILRAKSTL